MASQDHAQEVQVWFATDIVGSDCIIIFNFVTYTRKSATPGWELRSIIIVELLDYSSTAACAAANGN